MTSRKPKKQRKARYTAPWHRRHKYLTAKLSPELVDKHGIKRIPVRKGDTVYITRGAFRDSEGDVIEIDMKIRDRIIKYLLDVLDQNELISYSKKERILKHINEFLNQNQIYLNYDKLTLRELIDRISNAINVILRKIKMEDQFRTRMDLVSQNQFRPIVLMVPIVQEIHRRTLQTATALYLS